MKTNNQHSLISDNRSGMSDTLRNMDPRLYLGIGLISCAVVAYYVPLIIIALNGAWVNNLTMMVQLLVAILLLSGQNLIGNRYNKILLTGIIFAAVLDSYEAYSLLSAPSWSAWRANWMVFFLPTIACLLNAWLFLRFKAAADLKG